MVVNSLMVTKDKKVEIGVTGILFTSGTRMLFQQSTAPTGWTKDTSKIIER